MAQRLREALGSHPLFFEPVPPSIRARSDKVPVYLDSLVARLRELPRLDAVDVPELVDENHEGRPYYRTGDPRTFGRSVAAKLDCDVVVNKVVAHLPSSGALADWARETLAEGIRNAVLVGGSSRYIPYPGPAVVEANRICAAILGPEEGCVGNIAIPQREGEAHRMLAKTRAGAAFFTTQILFDSDSTLRTLRDYEALCAKAGLTPSTVLLSFAPLVDEADAEFVRWLGADIPENAERWILNGDESHAGSRSIEHAERVWDETRDGIRSLGITLSLGVNVEQLAQRHLGVAVEMLRHLAGRVDGSASS